MRFLPRDPVRRNSALVMVLAAAGLYLFHARIRVPRAKRADMLETRVGEMLEKNRQAESASAIGGNALEERLARYESHLLRLETLIPSSGDVARLLEAVSQEARRAGVEMTMMRPRPRIAGEFYQQWGYDVAVRGRYHAVGAFVTGVASLERIVVPGNVVVARPSGTAAAREVLATLEIRTYVAVASSDGVATESLAKASESRLPVEVQASAVQAALPSQSRRPLREPPPQQLQATRPLVFEREVFRYPATARRDPFAPPSGAEAPAGDGRLPRLLGLILHQDPSLGIALLARAASEGADAPLRPLRLRVGEKAAGLRLVEIAQDRVVVEIATPNGAAERRTLLLPRRSRGRPPRRRKRRPCRRRRTLLLPRRSSAR